MGRRSVAVVDLDQIPGQRGGFSFASCTGCRWTGPHRDRTTEAEQLKRDRDQHRCDQPADAGTQAPLF